MTMMMITFPAVAIMVMRNDYDVDKNIDLI